MSRQAFLDAGIGERRGVVLLAGQPERLIFERDVDFACQRLDARSVARVRRIERGQGLAFLAMVEGPDAVAPAGRLVEGQMVEVAVSAEPRADKGPSVVIGAPAQGEPRVLAPGPSLESRLTAWAGQAPVLGALAREAADLAEEAALDTAFALPGGGRLTLEATRALVAVDIDIADRRGGDAKRLAKTANLTAITETARLLRLKGLGGLVVIDLVGKGHDGPAMAAAAKAAFAADEPGVSIGPISRFGLMELAVPHRFTPIAEQLLDAGGQLSPPAIADRAGRAMEREGRAAPGARLTLHCAPDVAEAFAPHLKVLSHSLGARLSVEPDVARRCARFEIESR